ncbi:hypothetical protein [Nocardioides limicola]|uniref:hypothetical protein n=1 Tax=Nocardioides limicola TaxID=2803368 RepID=UPI00193B6521|nr:hypothetical protein [Nocardioides sp. DJM-14]
METHEFEERLTEVVGQERRRARRRLAMVAGGLVVAMAAVNMAPVAANHLTVKTSDIQKGAVTTPKIKKNAVKAGKIAGGAVTTGKIANGAVSTAKLANGAVTGSKLAGKVDGVALAAGQAFTPPAGVLTASTSFNRVGGNVTVQSTGTGVYDVTVPGATLTGGAAFQVTPTSITVFANPGWQLTTHRNRHCTATPAAGKLRVYCFNADGDPANMGFTFVVFKE